MLTVLLFPEKVEQGLDLRQHFEANRLWFFAIAALLPPLDALDTLLKGRQRFLDQGLIYPITLLLLFVLMITASLTSSKRFHALFALFFLAYILAFITVNLRVLN